MTTDPRGDANESVFNGHSLPNPQPSEPTLDVLALTVTGNASVTQFALRVDQLPTRETAPSAQGRGFEIDFGVGGLEGVVQARFGLGGERYLFGLSASHSVSVTQGAGVTGFVDRRRKLIVVRIRTSLMQAGAQPRVGPWNVTSNGFVGTVDDGTGVPFDHANGTRVYVVGTHCGS